MNKLFLALAIVVSVVSAPVLAQDKPKVELFGGYSYVPVDFGPDGHGWNVSVVANVHRWFGVKADVSGHYAHTRSTFTFLPPFPVPGTLETRTSERVHTVVFGPQTRFLQWKRVSLYQHAMFGLSLDSSHVSETFNGQPLPTFHMADHGFAMVLGGGLDVQVSPRLAIRAGQTDYLFTRISGFNGHSFCYSGGVVCRFGKR